MQNIWRSVIRFKTDNSSLVLSDLLRPRNVTFVLVLAIVGVTAIIADARISTKAVTHDAAANLATAQNLIRCQVYSHHKIDKCPAKATMGREPFPNILLAIWMGVRMSDVTKQTFSQLNSGLSIRHAKQINVIFAVSLVIASFFATKFITNSEVLSVAATVAVAAVAVTLTDTLYTELLAALTILISSYALSVLIQYPQRWLAVVTGSLIGIAALTKAIIFYLFPVVALGVLALLWLRGKALIPAFLMSGLVLIGGALVTGPWIARNLAVFDDARIASRSGGVLYYRYLLNNMNQEEYRGSFYIWAPEFLRRTFFSRLGYENSDIRPGGSLERLLRKHPEDAIAIQLKRPDMAATYRRQATAEYYRLEEKLGSKLVADRELQRLAIKGILSDLHAHIAVAIPVAWQMIWVKRLPAGLAMILFLLGLVVAPITSVMYKRWDVTAFTLLPLLVFGIYVGTTHGIPRYMEPLLPIMIVNSFILVGFLLSAIAAWRPNGAKRVF